ncbi:addiction module toxin RelE [Citrobacter amalonaticus]|uniref:Addiction module toxin RelE n=1 Tax=Citrobacter amalonaticus TaxID=35703 RepID=A0A2S4RX79_CITAM|nr:addiction module toxin RelE [Citrobacter amalonaticus]POT74268.1 addiction module toxin RelE [Citrobacter amalonaticus]POU65069.1 addiction module toxin RelE [Citrobacter amalonaticus]POV03903.1 addiction module toxin RelE [Citrobacter amalonaticus]
MKAAAKTLYAESFKVHQGGRHVNPQELTQVSGWGSCVQSPQRQLEG